MTQRDNAAGKLAIAMLPGVSPARPERSHKRRASSGMTLNLKPQQAFPELAMVGRTLTFRAVPASHRKPGETQKPTINHFNKAEFTFSMKTLGF